MNLPFPTLAALGAVLLIQYSLFAVINWKDIFSLQRSPDDDAPPSMHLRSGPPSSHDELNIEVKTDRSPTLSGDAAVVATDATTDELKAMLIETKNGIEMIKSQNDALERKMNDMMEDKLSTVLSEMKTEITSQIKKASGPEPPSDDTELMEHNMDQPMVTPHEQNVDKSLLLLTSIKIQEEVQISRELSWIQDDFSAVCEFYTTCHWMVNVVATSKELLKNFQQASSSFMLNNIKWSGSVSTKVFNKFIFVQKNVDEMLNYDLVLLKDSDQRLTSFSWPTFIEKRGDSVISGPLRRDVNSDCKERRGCQIHQACHYQSPTRPQWAAELYDNVIPVQVPWLECYFVLMDAKFANFYFNLALRDTVINQVGDWGVDGAWCGAAKVWDGSRPGCYLIPLISDHEDTRQIEKSDEFKQKARESVDGFMSDPILGGWIRIAAEWMPLIKSSDLNEMEQHCRRMLNLDTKDAFDLKACTARAGLNQLDSIQDKEHTIQLIRDVLNGKNSIQDEMRLSEAKDRLVERLTGKEDQSLPISVHDPRPDLQNSSVKYIFLLGERNSGTNYIEQILADAFYPQYSYSARNTTHSSHFKFAGCAPQDNEGHACSPVFQFKHMFRHTPLSMSEMEQLQSRDDILWVLAVRNPCLWVDAMYRNPWHLCNPLHPPSMCENNYFARNASALAGVSRVSFLRDMPWWDNIEAKFYDHGDFVYPNGVFELRSHKLKLMSQLIEAVGPHRVKLANLEEVSTAPATFVTNLSKEFGLEYMHEAAKGLKQSDKTHGTTSMTKEEWLVVQEKIDWELESKFGFNQGDCLKSEFPAEETKPHLILGEVQKKTEAEVSIIVIASHQRSSSTFLSGTILGSMPCHLSLNEIFLPNPFQSGDAWATVGKELGLEPVSRSPASPSLLASFVLEVARRRCEEMLSKGEGLRNQCNNHCWVNLKQFPVHLPEESHAHEHVWDALIKQNNQGTSSFAMIVLIRDVKDRYKSYWLATRTGDWRANAEKDHKEKLVQISDQVQYDSAEAQAFYDQHNKWFKRVREYIQTLQPLHVPVVNLSYDNVIGRPVNITQSELHNMLVAEKRVDHQKPKSYLPNVLQIGAQKAGTTSFADWLFSNGVCKPKAIVNGEEKLVNEVHFFDKFALYDQGIARYVKSFWHCFDDGREKLVMDATPDYLPLAQRVHDTYASVDADALSKVKLICILREPVARELSWYNHRVDQFRKTNSEDTPRTDTYWGNLRFANGTIMPFETHTELILTKKLSNPHTSFGKYADHLKKWATLFGRDKLLVLSYDELVNNPTRVQWRVREFLGAELPGQLPHLNTRSNSNKLKRVPERVRQMLGPIFEESNQELYDFLASNPGPWMEQRPFPHFNVSH